MSWRAGAKLFADVWPHVRSNVRDRATREEFLGQFLGLFLEWDVDPADLADLDPEVRRALAALGSPVEAADDSGDDVSACVRELASAAEKDRITAAQAIEFFVHQTDNSEAAATIALKALANALADTSVKVRRSAAGSLDTLLADGFRLPATARKRLEAAARDTDPAVRKKVEKALARPAARGS